MVIVVVSLFSDGSYCTFFFHGSVSNFIVCLTVESIVCKSLYLLSAAREFLIIVQSVLQLLPGAGRNILFYIVPLQEKHTLADSKHVELFMDAELQTRA